MAFDKTLPSNTTKIRNYPTVLTGNFAGIQEADNTFLPIAINFADRTPLPDPNDPAALAATVKVYSKQDGAGAPQIYAINPSSVVQQLTNFGSVTAAAEGSVLLTGGIIIKWGTFTPAAAAGTFTFATAFPNNNFSTVLQQNGGAASATNSRVPSKSAANFTFDSLQITIGTTYSFIAIGN